MAERSSDCPITAIVYSESLAFQTNFAKAAAALAQTGARLAGLVQYNVPIPNRRKCDLLLEDLATGRRYRISEDRGPEARGCTLDMGLLLGACEAAQASVSERTNLVVLSKFGKAEAEGGGNRDLIRFALERDVKVVIGVPQVNLASFRAFAGSLASEVDIEEKGVSPGDADMVEKLVNVCRETMSSP